MGEARGRAKLIRVYGIFSEFSAPCFDLGQDAVCGRSQKNFQKFLFFLRYYIDDKRILDRIQGIGGQVEGEHPCLAAMLLKKRRNAL